MQKTKFPAVVATFVVCFAFWVLLTWSFTMQELIAGAVISLAVALFSARFFMDEEARREQRHRQADHGARDQLLHRERPGQQHPEGEADHKGSHNSRECCFSQG